MISVKNFCGKTAEELYKNNLGKCMTFKLLDDMVFHGEVIAIICNQIYIDNNGVTEEIRHEDIKWAKFDK